METGGIEQVAEGRTVTSWESLPESGIKAKPSPSGSPGLALGGPFRTLHPGRSPVESLHLCVQSLPNWAVQSLGATPSTQ